MNEDRDEMAAAEPLAGEELERMLARYARVRLDPSQAQSRRARAAVMEAAWRRRIASDASERGALPVRPRLFAGWSSRRLGVSLSAAVLAGLMLGTSGFAASRAGGPLYEARLVVETIALPSDPAQRVDAQVVAAQTRLSEAVEAAGRHDDHATVAALDAYDRTIAGLAGAEGPAAARALEAVQFHHTVLLQIATGAPDAAAAGIRTALERSEQVIERLAAAGKGGPSGTGGPAGGPDRTPNPNGGGKPTAKPEATGGPTAKPARTKDPAATQKPARTEAPVPTEKPTPEPSETAEPTEKPERTEAPRPTADPPGRREDDGREASPSRGGP